MDNQTEDFDKILDNQAEKRRLQNFDDLQNEMAGVDVGRIGRFLSPEARAIILNKRNGKVSGSMTALDLMLLNDPAYAEIYSKAMNRISEYESATERTLNKSLLEAETATNELKQTLGNAAQTSDGTRAFKDTKGDVWSENHQKLSEHVADQIEWRGSEPTREQYLQKLEEKKSVDKKVNDIRIFQTEVGAVRERLTDPDKPPTSEDIHNALKALEKRTPEEVNSELPKKGITPTMNAEHSLDISVPNL